MRSWSKSSSLIRRAERLRQPQSAPIQEESDKPIRAGGEGRKEVPHLGAGEHRGEAFGPVGAVERPKVAELDPEHLFVEEEEGIEGLVLGRGGHVAVRRQVVQKVPDVVFVKVAGMGGVVEANEAGDPAGVRLFRVITVLAAPADLPHLVEKLGRLVCGAGHEQRNVRLSVACGLKIRSLIPNMSNKMSYSASSDV